MKKPAIEIRRLGAVKQGYKVLTSWNPPPKTSQGQIFDVHIPDLAPNRQLWKNYRKGRINWSEFSDEYLHKLHSISSQDIVKQLALLSLRRTVVLLCNCSDLMRCHETILAHVIEECRKNGNFVMNY